MSVQMNPRRSGRIVDAGRGLAALVGVVGLVAGVPLALATWIGSPLPAEVPTLSEVTGALRDSYIPDEFLVKALALVCWLVWIELVASLLVEAVAYARGRRAGHVPLAGGLQRGAARLVATVALLGAVFASRGMPQPGNLPGPPPAPVAQPAASVVIDDGRAAPTTGPDEAAAPAPALTYQVQRRDTLWDIAERHLGDPFRWQEIFRINQGCPQPDGRCLTDPDLIYAGWQLRLPADAVGLGPAAPPPPPAKRAPVPGGPGEQDPSSLAIEGGMVLIDDGGDPGAGGADVLLVVDDPGVATHSFDGMVLLPAAGADDGGLVPGEPGTLAGPEPGRSDDRDRGSDDELASPAPPAGASAPPAGRHE
ncbi:MAG TPA: LysM peptidoglycan-binding domain-containing protein [Acidimicrobiales bacterium]|nr:LysM peptidoglycan-binding domain-containing protein [Acidimicrobiales bacterium]